MIPHFIQRPKEEYLSVSDPEKYDRYRQKLRELARKGFFTKSLRIGWFNQTLTNNYFSPPSFEDKSRDWIYRDDFDFNPLAEFMDAKKHSRGYYLYKFPLLTLEEQSEVANDFRSLCSDI